MLVRRNSAELSFRELEVLTLISRGLVNKDISQELNISLRTVEHHRRHCVEKLRARNGLHAVMIAVCNGIIAPLPGSLLETLKELEDAPILCPEERRSDPARVAGPDLDGSGAVKQGNRAASRS